MVKSGSENFTLQQTVVNRVSFRDEQLVQLYRALLLRRALHLRLNALVIATWKFLILSLNLFCKLILMGNEARIKNLEPQLICGPASYPSSLEGNLPAPA